jgi:predicted metal-dependent HD superfamily phosphohydrolase
VEESAVAVFALIDEWIASAGRTDPWLALGLELMDSWQTGGDAATGQAHLADLLGELKALRRTVPPPPDPVALAVWFHHAGSNGKGGLAGLETGAATAYQALSGIGEPELAAEVARLVRLLGRREVDPGDLPGRLLCSVHRAAMSPSHLAPVPGLAEDQ